MEDGAVLDNRFRARASFTITAGRDCGRSEKHILSIKVTLKRYGEQKGCLAQLHTLPCTVAEL